MHLMCSSTQCLQLKGMCRGRQHILHFERTVLSPCVQTAGQRWHGEHEDAMREQSFLIGQLKGLASSKELLFVLAETV